LPFIQFEFSIDIVYGIIFCPYADGEVGSLTFGALSDNLKHRVS